MAYRSHAVCGAFPIHGHRQAAPAPLLGGDPPLVASAAFLDAQGIMQVVGASLGADAETARDSAAHGRGSCPRGARRALTRPTPTPILARNPFDSVTGPAQPVPRLGGCSAAESPTRHERSVQRARLRGREGARHRRLRRSDWSFAALETWPTRTRTRARAPAAAGRGLDGKTVNSSVGTACG